MTENLINPSAYIAGSVKDIDHPYGSFKFYLAKLYAPNLPLLIGREKHKQSSAAVQEARAWKDSLVAEYEQALLHLTQESALPRSAGVGDEPTSESAAVVEPVA